MKRHDYGSAYVSFPWTAFEAECLAAAWPHLEELDLQLNVLDLDTSGMRDTYMSTGFLIRSHDMP